MSQSPSFAQIFAISFIFSFVSSFTTTYTLLVYLKGGMNGLNGLVEHGFAMIWIISDILRQARTFLILFVICPVVAFIAIDCLMKHAVMKSSMKSPKKEHDE